MLRELRRLAVSATSASSRSSPSEGLGPAPWRTHGGVAGCFGAVRGKKWKPFHNMYKANFIRKERLKQIEVQQQEAAELEAQAGDPSAAIVTTPRSQEPPVGTTPFQATRLLRAFDVIPDKDAQIRLWTRLNIDMTRESVRGTCHLPHGLATKVKVLAFCSDDMVEEMIAAGADFAGISEPVRRINQGWLGFDRCLATPSIMPQVMKVARVLGPRKMMPNPKSGTVVQNLKQAIREAKGGTLLEYRAEGDAEVQAVIADAGMSDAKVLENMKFFIQALLRARPRSGASAVGGKAAPAPMIPGAGAGGGGKSQDDKDQYFLESALQLTSAGAPPIRMDSESVMPASTGYFR